MSTQALTDHGFESAVRIVLGHEGGLVDHPDDPGGTTNYGISLRWAIAQHVAAGDDSLELLDINGDQTIDAKDIRNMSLSDAKLLYRRFFWEPNRYRQIHAVANQIKIFDLCVNMGPRQAHKLAQRAVRAATGNDIADDGILGPVSFHQINQADSDQLLAALRSEQAGFYRALVIRNDALRKQGIDVPDFGKFLTGWLRRAYS